MPNLSDLIPSLIRTYVPLGVAWLAGWLLTYNVDLGVTDQAALATGLGAIAAGLYYAAVRLLEQRFPAIGILLGSTKTPAYVAPGKPVTITHHPDGSYTVPAGYRGRLPEVTESAYDETAADLPDDQKWPGEGGDAPEVAEPGEHRA